MRSFMLKKIITKIVAVIKAKIATTKTKNAKVFKKYTIGEVVFRPDEYHQIQFDDKKVRLSSLQSKMLMYFAENPSRRLNRDDILQNVWESQEPNYEVITRTLSELRYKLPEDLIFTPIRGVGYIFEHHVAVEQVKNERLERYIAHSPSVKMFLYTVVISTCISILATSSYGVASLYYSANPPPRFGLINTDVLYTRDYLPRVPKLSPEGRFVAYRLSKEAYGKSYLGLFDSKLGDTEALVEIGPTDGFGWNLTGDKIVYQKRIAGKCEIYLLSFHNKEKIQFSQQHLSDCFNTTGRLSFAWFNDNEFYVNFTAKEEVTAANRMPQHHLYSFNIKTKERIKCATPDNESGVGFYSLNYDSSNETLYFLQTENFVMTRFFSYHNNQLKELAEVDYLVRFIAADNNRLIYKNNKNQFLINHPAANFSNAQELLINQPLQIGQPSLRGEQLIYMVGETFHFNLEKIQDNALTEIDLNGFNAYAMTKMNDVLIFASAQTGIFQLYQLNGDGQIKKISNMQKNVLIRDLNAVNNTLTLSTFDKVVLYQFEGDVLKPVETFQGYNRGILNTDGNRILLTTQKKDEVAAIYEKQIHSFFPSKKLIAHGHLAFYHQNNIIYINKERELIRLIGDTEHIVTTSVYTSGIEYTAVDGDEFYYIEPHKTINILYKVNLTTGNKNQIELTNGNPVKVEALNGKVYISTKQLRKTLFVKGKITVN